MKRKSALNEKSFQLSLLVFSLTEKLKSVRMDHVICRQLIRSGTAIGALVRESEYAQSRADFINKLSIALKEANETDYWLGIVLCAQPKLETEVIEMKSLLTELMKMLTSSIKTSKGKMNNI